MKLGPRFRGNVKLCFVDRKIRIPQRILNSLQQTVFCLNLNLRKLGKSAMKTAARRSMIGVTRARQ